MRNAVNESVLLTTQICS